MNFVEAIKSGFVNYTEFSGRACRSEYWFFTLFTFIGALCTGIADVAIVGDSKLMPLNLIFTLITLLPSVAVSVRRLHDVGKPGWWMLLLLTIVGFGVLIYWAARAGDQGTNRFGDDPLVAGKANLES